MGRFLESEKPHQMEFKANSAHFSQGARDDGVYRHTRRPFCLPLDYADENLLLDIRQPALQFFADHHIKWHDGQNGKPSNHLCDSQVCCVNFLFPFADKPDALASLLRPYFPTLNTMLPIESDSYVTFEWIGADNYL